MTANQWSKSGSSPGHSKHPTVTPSTPSTIIAAPTQKLLTPDDVATRLGVSRQYIVRQSKLGKIPAIRIGKCWRFLPASIDTWLVKEERAA